MKQIVGNAYPIIVEDFNGDVHITTPGHGALSHPRLSAMSPGFAAELGDALVAAAARAQSSRSTAEEIKNSLFKMNLFINDDPLNPK